MTSQPPPPPGPAGAGLRAEPAGPPPGGPQIAEFFDRIRRWGAVRPDDGRWAAGVAAALARRLGLDPLLVRGAFVVLALFGGVGLFLYGLGWLFLPEPDGRIHAQEVLRGVVTAGFIGGALCLVADASGGWAWGPRPFGGGFLGLAVVALVIWWFVAGRHRGAPGTWHPTVTAPTSSTPADRIAHDGVAGGDAAGAEAIPPYGTPPATAHARAWSPAATGVQTSLQTPVQTWTPPRVDRSRPSHALTSTVLGVALLGAGAVLLWSRIWHLSAPGDAVAAAVALGIVALGVLLAGVLGRRAGGLAPIGILLALFTLAASSPSSGDVVDWAGQRTWTPAAVTGTGTFNLGAGNARLDLSKIVPTGATASTPVEVDARVGVGNLTVVAPAGVAVRILASAGAGSVDNRSALAATPGGGSDEVARRGGHDVDVDVESGTAPILLVRADVGLGTVTLVSANG